MSPEPSAPPTPDKGSILHAGEELTAGQFLESSDGHFRLVMQGDGNLVEYVNERALWASNTGGHAGAFVVLQASDGNLVVYAPGAEPLWAANTGGNPGDFVGLQPDANVVVYSASQQPLWANNAKDSELVAGETLTTGQYIESGEGHFRLVMQGDGNLVEYVNERALWASNTAGNPGDRLVLQSSDGNLVIYGVGGEPLWAANTGGNPGDRLVLQGDANVVVYSQTGSPLWSSGPADSELRAGEGLGAGETLWSANRLYELAMQTDGNLVEYESGHPIWASNTAGHGGAFVVLQVSDGNLVVYAPGGEPLWAANTGGNPGDYLAVQDDSNVVVYTSSGQPIWASKSAGGGSVGERIVAEAKKWEGRPYCFDGGNENGPTLGKEDPENGLQCGVDGYDPSDTPGFDCTGLTLYAVYQATKDVLVHDSYQAREAITEYHPQVITNESELQPGDVVYFGGSLDYFVHAGVYAGGGTFVSAVTEGIGVKTETMSWEESGAGGLKFVGALRF